MSYLKKSYREILEKIDKKSKLPKDWNKFVEKQCKRNNLIIKGKGICTCTYCNAKFKSNKKVNQYEKCPNCKNEYLIKRSDLSYMNFIPISLIFLDKIDNEWVIRLFEVQSWYSKSKGKVSHTKAVEYGRVLINQRVDLCNNRMYSVMCNGYRINTYVDVRRWRVYNSGYYDLSTDGFVYPNNLKRLMKNTEYQYSQLWKLARKEPIDIKYYLKYNFASTEILIKMGLYKLALCPSTFNKKGNFKERFGVDKSYYEFMKRYNIDIDELEILKIYTKKNINKIRYLKKFREEDLKEISCYMSLDKFITYARKYQNFDMSMYIDYLGFIKDLELDIQNKKYLFPNNLKQEHDKYEKQIEIHKSQILRRKIKKRYNNLKDNIYETKKYIIFPAKSVKELEDESKQQHNCVRTYAEKYSNGYCDIYFMRENDNIKKSLVTVEVKDNKIVQSRTKYNNDITNNQKKFLDKWENNILKVA